MSPEALPRLSTAIVGATAGPLTQTIDARWLMAYNAAVSEGLPGPVAHPLFSVCYEWPVSTMLRARAIDAALAPLSVHASHDVVIHRLAREGDRLTTTGTVADVTPRRSGTLVLMKFETVDADSHPVTTTTYGSLYRGVSLTGTQSSPDRRAPEALRRRSHGEYENPDAKSKSPDGESANPDGTFQWSDTVTIAANAAHVYTECARIWNPIHTDEAVARAAGLPGIILHGTATLALCVSRILRHELAGDGTHVRGISARFTGVVRLPSTVVVRMIRATTRGIAFDAVDGDRRPVLGHGVVST